ncbi:hypothetical protein GPAL_3665 [Glaciecola pallidula DSM 14239 = ACAM 615]|uniref:Uncharacterized protein n=1 Tax=Brumicola pallidula DSM 14239 = ACAM 615 TaxID=1121922 RepID=K6Z2Q2_9ALTE|nr:hypothetical protein GPAL_3665 [Glaciecola pallidula DSM 14239 = ACAM 615]
MYRRLVGTRCHEIAIKYMLIRIQYRHKDANKIKTMGLIRMAYRIVLLFGQI